ncbi:Chemotaxis protein methyltransferase CheR [hydrothermal vent metagenome]|uniref:protein-glutamate O-methyltransferase n=1 Tax=hydrothermal vent metagenome TaxID=652676 RepID=A0A3B0YHK1_9ZZZZ
MLARSQSGKREREFEFTTTDFETARKTLYEQAGISLNDGKADLVYGRLARRLRSLRMNRFSDYLDYINSTAGEDEVVHFINALTTNLTAFFREPHHFEFLEKTAFPAAMQRHRSDKRVRLWSAGCSTGEEPYSIAMMLAESALSTSVWDTRLLATDLDSNVVATAREGRYAEQRIAGLTTARSNKWFDTLPGGADVQVKPALQEAVTFKRLNLMHDWPMSGPFDMIFCRNVVIYFDKPTQRQLFDRYADMLIEGGYLFLGHSETMHNLSDRFQLIGKTIYRKVK